MLELWIAACALYIGSGWILSALGCLNTFGYAMATAVIAIVTSLLHKQSQNNPVRTLRNRVHSFRSQGLPLLFLLVVLLSGLGGLIHPPNNYDALTYRVPRILHWWSTGSWHWMTTNNPRMNYSAEGFEWLMMPLLVFTKSDRFFFIINWISYLFFPGLIFSVFRKLGIASRVAWTWMWLLPTAYCYVLQSGSIGNDAIAVTFALASAHFALRARQKNSVRDLWFAFIAAALCSAIKAVNLPLYLPLAVIFLPALPILRRHVLISCCIIAFGIFVSFIPTAILNQHFASNWTGDPTDQQHFHVPTKLALVGNSIQLTSENLAPPIVPGALTIRNALWTHFPQRLREQLQTQFPHFEFKVGEVPQEENVGLGLGIISIVLVTAIALIATRKRGQRPSMRREVLIVSGAAWLAFAIYIAQSGIGTPGRLLCAYYPFLLLPLLAFPANDRLTRKKWWQRFSLVAASLVLVPLLLTPSRPLLPLRSILSRLSESHPHSAQLTRAKNVYDVYANRHDILAPMRQLLPTDVTKVGFMAGIDDTELSLWRPYGKRTVFQITNLQDIAHTEANWVVVKREIAEQSATEPLESWLHQNNYEIVSCATITSKIAAGPEQWCLVHKLATAKLEPHR